jgi:hypothetical protein
LPVSEQNEDWAVVIGKQTITTALLLRVGLDAEIVGRKHG